MPIGKINQVTYFRGRENAGAVSLSEGDNYVHCQESATLDRPRFSRTRMMDWRVVP